MKLEVRAGVNTKPPPSPTSEERLPAREPRSEDLRAGISGGVGGVGVEEKGWVRALVRAARRGRERKAMTEGGVCGTRRVWTGIG